MNRGIRPRRRQALVAAAIVIAGLAGASSAQAVTVDVVGNNNSSGSVLGIGGWAFGERNDITIQPAGAVRGDPSTLDPAFPLTPLSLVVTDHTTPIHPGIGTCIQRTTYSLWCTSLNGFDTVDADLGDAPSGSSFEILPNRNGYATPMYVLLQTRDGDDRISLSSVRGLQTWTLGGNDTIDVNDPSTFDYWRVTMHTGAGDDRISGTSLASTDIHCDDGNDTATLVGPRVTTYDCEQ